MTWRYIAAVEARAGEKVWSIHELYDGNSWTVDPIIPVGETLHDLRHDLEMMLADLKDGAWLDLDTGEVHRGES